MSRQRRWLLLLCFIAALRVFTYSAAFPLFNNVDEALHFDNFLHYAQGEVPRIWKPLPDASLAFIAIYGSPEYVNGPWNYPGGHFPGPAWQHAEAVQRAEIERYRRMLQANVESSQAPLYYLLAVPWSKLGIALGQLGGFLPYWVRFMDVPLAIALVLVGYRAAALVFVGDAVLPLAVAAMLACFPQDAFYAIQNDTLAAPLFGLVFICLLRWARLERPSALLGLGTGLALAAVGLTKISNLPLLAVGVAAAFFSSLRRKRWSELRMLIPFCLALGLPMLLWIGNNLAVYGDPTASVMKTRMLGWSPKPPSQWPFHPIFTPSGLWYFLRENLASLWRGEFVWWGQRLANRWLDLWYALSSLVCVAVALRSRGPLLLAALCLASLLGYLGFLSLLFDFGACAYPTPQLPYFTSGRLMLGGLVPFAILFVAGFAKLGRRFLPRETWRYAFAANLALWLLSEAWFSRGAFSSAYNWFHFL